MADDGQLEIITLDGVPRWNAWRTENREARIDLQEAELKNAVLDGVNFENANLRSAVLTGAHLNEANLRNCDLMQANLEGANLRFASLEGADLQSANLQKATMLGVSFTGVKLQGTNLSNADLGRCCLHDANFRGAIYTGANFSEAEITSNTLGLGRLPANVQSTLNLVEIELVEEDAPQEPKGQSLESGHNLTVGAARSIVEPAHFALQGLAKPNDISPEHGELFDRLVETVNELQQRLAAIEEQDQPLSEQDADLRNAVDQGVPLWKKAWEEFVLKGAGGVGSLAAQGTAFYAGFIAGTLWVTLGAGLPPTPLAIPV